MKLKITDKDKGYAALIKLKGAKGSVKVGVIGQKAGARKGGDALSNAELAVVHEFGTEDGRVPERSFLRANFDNNREKYIAHWAKLVRAIYEGKMTMKQALRLLGLEAEKDTKALIRAGIPPPNKPATIAAKGSSTPLIDTGQLIGAISSEVEMGKGKED